MADPQYPGFISQRQEHEDFHYSTPQELDRAEARDIGAHDPERCWILTDRDVWHLNPYFKGEIERHPEDGPYEDEEPDTEPTNPAPECYDDDYWSGPPCPF